MKNWILRKLKEPSSWAGLLVAASPFLPWDLSIEQKSALSTALGSIVGALLIFANEPVEKNKDFGDNNVD